MVIIYDSTDMKQALAIISLVLKDALYEILLSAPSLFDNFLK